MVPKPPALPALSSPASFVSPTLKHAQLQRLAFLCGIPKTGVKADIAVRLNAVAAAAAAAAQTPRRQQIPGQSTAPERRVLSIDLGLRNLAFTLITSAPPSVPPSRPQSSSKSKSKSKSPPSLSPSSSSSSSSSSSPLHPPRIHLHAWRHQSLVPGVVGATAKRPKSKPKTKTATPPDSTATAGDEPGPPTAAAAADPEAEDPYSPSSLARTTTALVRDALLPLRPTHVLVERQRFRSRGAPAVQEWTLRVNTLEAMLHASLRALREYGIWRPGLGPDADADAGAVISVAPSRVAQFWIEDDAAAELLRQEFDDDDVAAEEEEEPTGVAEGRPKTKKKTKTKAKTKAAKPDNQDTKKLKIKLLSRWLSRGDDVVAAATPDAAATLGAYLRRATGGRRGQRRRTLPGRRPSSSSSPSALTGGDAGAGANAEAEAKADAALGPKLDDLTDCLLQGMAWVRWEENKLLLGQAGGVEKLLGGLVGEEKKERKKGREKGKEKEKRT